MAPPMKRFTAENMTAGISNEVTVGEERHSGTHFQRAWPILSPRALGDVVG